ncbi:MAG: hypothetical protein U5J98_06390 [Halobacteriales archaeon]|nr:hypothetical protein [Halobacteriales archaeon]
MLLGAGASVASLAGCGGPSGNGPAFETTRSVTATGLAMPDGGPFGFTHHRPDGNRVVEGTGSLPAGPRTRELGFEPAWVVGLPAADGIDWAVVGTDGEIAAYRSGADDLSEITPTPDRLPRGVPPVLAAGPDGPRLLVPPGGDASRLTHPFPLGDGRTLVVGGDGDVWLWDGTIVDRLSVGALPDARIVAAAPGTYAVLGGATTRYDHGALGDDIEAAELVVFEVADGLVERSRASFDGAVAEGLLPIASELGGDEPLLIVTLTDADRGARLAAFDLDGMRVATGPAIGTGFRWRHQLCVAPFAPDGTAELAVVKTPHIGGVAEFYRRSGDALELVAERAGYSTHAFGSRNLDGALAGDLDGDGAIELLVPTQSREELAAIRRTPDGTAEPWRLPLPARLATNLAGVTTASGHAVVAAGTADGTLHLWG